MNETQPCSPTASLWGCAKHALIERTCCQKAEVFVTEGDRRRIEAHTGRGDFWEHRRATDPSYLDHDDDPNWVRWAFREDGTRPILKRRPAGDCAFLGSDGCTLPAEVRPLVCRLYPFEYSERGLRAADASRCPAFVVPPGSTVLQMLGMRREDAERWRRMLYEEIRVREASDAHRAYV